MSSSLAALEAAPALGDADDRLSSIAAFRFSSIAGRTTGASRTRTPSGVRWDVIASGSTFAVQEGGEEEDGIIFIKKAEQKSMKSPLMTRRTNIVSDKFVTNNV